MKQLIIIEPKSISVTEKHNLEKNGFIVIEHPSPEKVRVIQQVEGMEIQGSILILSLLEGVTASVNNEERFAKELLRRLKESEQSK